MPLIETKGAGSAQGFGEFAKSAAANYIEDVFSTWLYTGTGASQTITNNIDLSTKGGLTWIKSRSAATDHKLTDTVRGATKALISSTTAAETTDSTGLTAFGTTGFTIGADTNYNNSGATYASWTFRKQPKFFDIVTYTGTGSARTIAHSLGSAPGCIIVKCTSTAATNWQVYHNGLTSAAYIIQLNLTNAQSSATTVWNSTAPTSSVFSVGTSSDTNASGRTYVAYIFASNAGGFGLNGTDNVITCGSYTGAAVPNAVTLGYEPQWVMVKRTDTAGYDWIMLDVMRGDSLTGQAVLSANLTDAEATYTNYCYPTATGFAFAGTNAEVNAAGGTYIYIAIRRGPMKTPTVGTSVFSPISSAASVGTQITTGFPIDLQIQSFRSGPNSNVLDRLRGVSSTSTETGPRLETASTAAEATYTDTRMWGNTGFQINSSLGGASTAYYSFQRAPGFFDVVCYNRTSGATVTHNLSVIPELLIVKRRGGVEPWGVMRPNTTGYLLLNVTDALNTALSATATSTTFTLGAGAFDYNDTYVAYLFATCLGVSKVGSYTGTGATQTISCGFTGGARFVLVKRTDTTGGWYVWDTARGMISGTDPSLLFNSTAAEVNANSIYTATGGFQIVSTAAGINASGGTYIFLAIA